MTERYGTAEPILTIGRHDGLLEIGCTYCGPYGYWSKDPVKLPAHLTFAETGMVLTCSNCGQKNKEPGYPLWVRPDSRAPVVGQLVLTHPARIVFEGRNEIQQRKFLKMRVNARMRPPDWTDD